MKLARSTAGIFVPDRVPVRQALARTTHLGIAAHPDDLEIMAPAAILDCFGREDRWFTGVVVTDGVGSPRAGLYARRSDAEMRAVRRREAEKAAAVGEFGALVMLDHPSAAVKTTRRAAVRKDLRTVLLAARPDVVITHNLGDRHDTHVALALRVIEVLRALPRGRRPRKVYGGEVWRSLDWLPDANKMSWDVSKRENIQTALLGVFDSQISGGKRHDLAAAARRRVHATYRELRKADAGTGLSVAMDLTPLVRDPGLDPAEYAARLVWRFAADVGRRIRAYRT